MNSDKQEIARLTKRVADLEAELRKERKAGDAFWDELLGQRTPRRTDSLDDTIRAASHQLDGIRAFPRKETAS